jgi:dihydrolipoamide dehydrogenase
VKKMVGRKDTVVKQNNDGILYLFKKNKVSFFHGRGAFAKAGRRRLRDHRGGQGAGGQAGRRGHRLQRARAAGCALRRRNVLSNDGALRIGAVPKKLGLIGRA